MKALPKDWFNFQNTVQLQNNVPKQFKIKTPASVN